MEIEEALTEQEDKEENAHVAADDDDDVNWNWLFPLKCLIIIITSMLN